jgi:hypothetical protein
LGPVFSLDPARQGYLFTVGNDAGIGKVTLILSGDVTLKGHKDNANGLISVKSNGSLSWGGNAKISGNTYNVSKDWRGRPAAGRYPPGGSFTMRDNAGISDNKIINGHGGGVAIYDGGTFTMEGGTISRNTATSTGNWAGGVSLGSDAIFSKTGGTIHGGANTLNASSKKGEAIWADPAHNRDTTVTGNLDKTGTSYTGEWAD